MLNSQALLEVCLFKMKLCWVYDATSNSSQKQLHVRESEVNNLQFTPQGNTENTVVEIWLFILSF